MGGDAMLRRAIFLFFACAGALSGCGPSGPPPQAGFNYPAVNTMAPPMNTGPTMSEAGPAPPAFDRYGNANFDANGTYTGGHGIGRRRVDNPRSEQTTWRPEVEHARHIQHALHGIEHRQVSLDR